MLPSSNAISVQHDPYVGCLPKDSPDDASSLCLCDLFCLIWDLLIRFVCKAEYLAGIAGSLR